MAKQFKQSREVLSQARAVIIWGDPEEEAFDLLIDNGYDSHQAKEHIVGFKRERGLHVRHQGIIDAIKGVLFLLFGVIATFVLFYMDSLDFWIPALAYFLSIGSCLFGIWKLIKGTERIIAGGKISGSLTEFE